MQEKLCVLQVIQTLHLRQAEAQYIMEEHVSQLTARTFPAIITREFYFKHLFLELPCFIILLNQLLSPPTPFHIENYLFLWKALASTAADNYEAKRPSSPSPAEANGRNEGFPAAGDMVPACSGPKASLRSRGCGRRAASADSEAEARFKTTFARSLARSLRRRGEGKLRQLATDRSPFLPLPTLNPRLLRELLEFRCLVAASQPG